MSLGIHIYFFIIYIYRALEYIKNMGSLLVAILQHFRDRLTAVRPINLCKCVQFIPGY